jgi:O-antigen/teichoic acid export membrane protein
MMIINLLLIIPSAASQSLLAEGSRRTELSTLSAENSYINCSIPVSTYNRLIILFGNYILLVFGKSFSVEGYTLLRLFALSTIFTSINILLNVVLNIQKGLIQLFFISFIGPLILIILTYVYIAGINRYRYRVVNR